MNPLPGIDPPWRVYRMEVGELLVNCYLVARMDGDEALVVDPGGEAERILEAVEHLGLRVKAIVNTHGHGDHIADNRAVKEATGVPIVTGRREAPLLTDPWKNVSAQFGMPTTSPPADRVLDEGDEVEVGAGRLKVLDTPGHSPGSITLVGERFALVGDLVFAGSIGRTDLPGGGLELLLRMVREKIFPLGDDCILLPGHGPPTTVGEERRSNPFLSPGMRFAAE